MDEVKKRLIDKGIEIELTKKAEEFLVERGFDQVFGARPLKRTIQRFLEDPLAERIIASKFKKGKKIKVDAKADCLTFN